MPRVLIADKLSPKALEIFQGRDIQADVRPGMDAGELLACIGDYDGLAVRSATKATAELLAAAPNLKIIGRAGIGVDNIDLPAATARGIVVMNTPFGNAITTAEHALALISSLVREIPAASTSTKAGKWEKSRFMGLELTEIADAEVSAVLAASQDPTAAAMATDTTVAAQLRAAAELENALARPDVIGGTAPTRVHAELKAAAARLGIPD